MDHYTAEAYKVAIGTIQENIKRLEKYGKQGSGDVHNLKNWRRFGAAFAWDPSVYKSILANPDASPEKLMRMLRTTESNLMKQWEVIDKVAIHHKTALRSAGDLPIDLNPDLMEEVREILLNEYGIQGGNGPINLNPESNVNERIHQFKRGSKLSAYEAGEVPEDLRTEYLHRKGQNFAAFDVLNLSSKEIAGNLAKQIQQQTDRFNQAQNNFRVKDERAEFNQGTRKFLTDQNGNPIDAYSKSTSPEQIAALNATGKALTDQDGTPLANNATKAFIEGQTTDRVYHADPGKPLNKLIKLVNASDGRLRLGGFTGQQLLSLGQSGLRSANAAIPGVSDVTETFSEKTGAQIARGEYRQAAVDTVTNVAGNTVSNLPTTAFLVGSMAALGKVSPALATTAGGALGTAMLPLTIGTSMVAAKNMYSGYLKENTGESLGQHVDKYYDKQNQIDEKYEALNNYNSIPENAQIKQGEKNPVQRFLNEKVKSRQQLIRERFDPSKGEFGISELLINR